MNSTKATQEGRTPASDRAQKTETPSVAVEAPTERKLRLDCESPGQH